MYEYVPSIPFDRHQYNVLFAGRSLFNRQMNEYYHYYLSSTSFVVQRSFNALVSCVNSSLEKPFHVGALAYLCHTVYV